MSRYQAIDRYSQSAFCVVLNPRRLGRKSNGVKPTAAGDKPAASRWERTQARLRGDHSQDAAAARYGCANCHDTSSRISGNRIRLDLAQFGVGNPFLHPHVSG